MRIATWNFLGSEHKQKEVGELLVKNNIDVVAGQEKEDTGINVEVASGFISPVMEPGMCILRECSKMVGKR